MCTQVLSYNLPSVGLPPEVTIPSSLSSPSISSTQCTTQLPESPSSLKKDCPSPHPTLNPQGTAPLICKVFSPQTLNPKPSHALTSTPRTSKVHQPGCTQAPKPQNPTPQTGSRKPPQKAAVMTLLFIRGYPDFFFEPQLVSILLLVHTLRCCAGVLLRCRVFRLLFGFQGLGVWGLGWGVQGSGWQHPA